MMVPSSSSIAEQWRPLCSARALAAVVVRRYDVSILACLNSRAILLISLSLPLPLASELRAV
jgi:hypothetical protein